MVINEQIYSDIKTLIEDSLGSEFTLAGYKLLNSQREVINVARLELTTEGGRAKSVIVKHINEESYSYKLAQEPPPHFIEESFNYSFLSRINESFKFFPSLLARTKKLIILEDLGPDLYEYRSKEELMESMVMTIAAMHSAAEGRYPLFKRLRQEEGMPELDKRSYSMVEQNELFEIGVKNIRRVGKKMGLTFGNGIERELSRIKESINEPGPFITFIHDDLVSRRQSVTIEGGLYLIDFEHGKFVHRLLDLSKILLGKIELTLKRSHFFLNHSGLPVSLIQLYRKELTEKHGVSFDNDIWKLHSDAALIYSTFVNLGALFHVPTSYKPLGGLSAVLFSVIKRLFAHIEKKSYYHQILTILEKIGQRE